MSDAIGVQPSKAARNPVNRGEEPQLDLQNQLPRWVDEVQSAKDSEHATKSAQHDNAANGQEEKFDPTEGQVILQSATCVKVSPDRLQGGGAKDVFLPARMSGIPWAGLESLYRAFWIVLSAALGVSREDVKCATGERIAGTYLYSAASYQLTPEDLTRLGEADVRRRLEVGIALLGERYLWVPTELASRFADLPWQEMLSACQQARDEVKAKKLPCQVGVEFEGGGLSFVLVPELAPRRPAKVDTREVTEVGHSHGYLYRRNHKLHFSKGDSHDPVDISFPPRQNSCRIPFPSG